MARETLTEESVKTPAYDQELALLPSWEQQAAPYFLVLRGALYGLVYNEANVERLASLIATSIAPNTFSTPIDVPESIIDRVLRGAAVISPATQ